MTLPVGPPLAGLSSPVLGLQVAHVAYHGVLLFALVLALRAARRRPNAAWLLAPPALAVAGLPLAGFIGLPLGIGAFGVIGLFAAAVFGHLPLGLVLLARTRRDHWAAKLAYVSAAALLAVAGFSFVVEPHRLEVSQVEIETAKLTQPLRIAILADIQTADVGQHERRAVELAMAQEPDLVLFPGDFVQVFDLEHRIDTRKALRRVFEEVGLEAPLGAYAVRGNTDSDGWEQCLQGLPVQTFRNSRTFRIERDGEPTDITLTALDIFDSRDPGYEIPSVDGLHIVFGHHPDFALGDTDADLLVAGHCHGGQVVLPFLGPPLTLSEIPRDWTSGTREIRPGTWLSVSRGIGMERGGAPPLRFLCRPEVVIVDLVPALP